MEEAPGWGAEARARSRQYGYEAVMLPLLTGGNAVYDPSTKETRAAYDALLGVLQQQLGGRTEVLGSAADGVLAALKNDKLTNAADRKKQIETLINPISSLMFDQLVSIGKLITDFHDVVAGDSAGAPSTDGTHMMLDYYDLCVAELQVYADHADSNNFYQVEDDSDEYDMVELSGARAMQMDGELYGDYMPNYNTGFTVHVEDNDAYWFQRNTSESYEYIDPQHDEPTGEAGLLTGNAVYEPRSKETRAAYEALLGVIQQQLGGQAPDSLGSAADEVLATLKNDKVTNADKKKETEKHINPMSNQMFDQLVSIGKLITDFRSAVACDSARRAFTHMSLDE